MKEHLNSIFLGDINELLKKLPDKSVDVVYSDPDYNVGKKYGNKSYTIKFDKYIEWYIGLAKQSLRVLKDSGNMFLINYPKQNSYLRVKYLDDICYEVLDYAWVYKSNVGHILKNLLLLTEVFYIVEKQKIINFIRIM